MAKITDIIKKLETIAPIESQEEWDNSGWQIKLSTKTTDKIMLALNATEDTIKQAAKVGCGLIITHHPLIFGSLKTIKNQAIIKAIQNNIQVYSAHTNFDKSEIGTTQTLINTLKNSLKIKDTHKINEFTISAKLENALSSKELISKIKKGLNLKSVKISNPKQEIKTIAFCAGSGAEFIQDATMNKIDCFITGDIKYHNALDSKIMLIDIGHFESEIIALNSLKEALQIAGLEIVLAKETPIFETI